MGKLDIVDVLTIDVNLDSYPENTGVANFNNLSPFDMVLVSTEGAISGFSRAICNVHTGAFLLGNPFSGTFSVVLGGNESVLHYAAV